MASDQFIGYRSSLKIGRSDRHSGISAQSSTDHEESERSPWLTLPSTDKLPSSGGTFTSPVASEAQNRECTDAYEPATTLLEFVERIFIPQHVACRRSAGRVNFQTILKFVLAPASMNRIFRVKLGKSKDKLGGIVDWPYMCSICLHDVSTEMVQYLVSRMLQSGYSIQTATHVRNVVRTIFAHAMRTGQFSGHNPASAVVLPEMERRQAPTLTMDQLKSVIEQMQYPERQMALIAILTNMSIAEICGLQWKYVNLSDAKRLSGCEWLLPRTISVRKQSYRESSEWYFRAAKGT